MTAWISLTKSALTCVALALLATVVFASTASAKTAAPRHGLTANHQTFKELQGPFKDAAEVSAACRSCHNTGNEVLHKTLHWTWRYDNKTTGQTLGMRNVMNTAYGSVAPNLTACTICHIGFGRDETHFDTARDDAVDCLFCHDTTKSYAFSRFHEDGNSCTVCHDETIRKTDIDRPDADLTHVAQNVGATSRETCGSCHFNCAGDGVKHGDLDSSLLTPARELDVHMSSDGANLDCADCHAFTAHEIQGSRYAVRTSDSAGLDPLHGPRATCESCHGSRPMKDERLNNHTDRVACQTCHIPSFARGGVPTRTVWDWSTAGERDRKGRALVKKDDEKRITYATQKGSFEFASNVTPTYKWFNGDITFRLPGEKIDPSSEVLINAIHGDETDPKSRIYPMKIMRAKQPYDEGNQTLLPYQLAGRDRDAYWTSYKWDRALKAGADATGLDFSGKSGFVSTAMAWPITHMVAPKENALECDSCHTRQGRLADLAGFYVPGRDNFEWLDKAGFIAALMALVGVVLHGLGRFAMSFRKR